MCQQQRPRLLFMDLPKCGAVNIKKFTDAALGGFNLAAYLVSRETDEECRYFDEQRLESQPLVDFCKMFDF